MPCARDKFAIIRRGDVLKKLSVLKRVDGGYIVRNSNVFYFPNLKKKVNKIAFIFVLF